MCVSSYIYIYIRVSAHYSFVAVSLVSLFDMPRISTDSIESMRQDHINKMYEKRIPSHALWWNATFLLLHLPSLKLT